MKTFSTEGIVLKRSNVGEADRIITVFTRSHGKMQCIAKGVRKITSSRRSALEPGTHARLFFAESHNLPILTQAQCIEEFAQIRSTLKHTRDLLQILEILDTIMVESEAEEVSEIFDDVLIMIHNITAQTSKKKVIIELLAKIVRNLGFQDIQETNFSSITEYVGFLANKKMKSFEYLTVSGERSV